MYRQELHPLGGSLAWSALFAALPLLTLFVLLGVFRVRAWLAAISGLGLALVIALLVWSMPVGQAFLAATEGPRSAVPGAVDRGQRHLGLPADPPLRALRHPPADLRRDQPGPPDPGVIIAFCFGALLEALAGFAPRWRSAR